MVSENKRRQSFVPDAGQTSRRPARKQNVSPPLCGGDIIGMNDHHIKTMCRVQEPGRSVQGQGHSRNLKISHIPYMDIVNVDVRVRLITLF